MEEYDKYIVGFGVGLLFSRDSNYEQQKKTQSGRTSPERKDPRTPANQRSQKYGEYPESLQGNHSGITWRTVWMQNWMTNWATLSTTIKTRIQTTAVWYNRNHPENPKNREFSLKTADLEGFDLCTGKKTAHK